MTRSRSIRSVLVPFLRDHILGMIIFAIITGVVGNFAYDALQPVVSYVSKPSLPRAARDQFSVGVCTLGKDQHDGKYSRAIVNALNEIGGFQVLQFPRTIDPLSFADPRDGERRGHDTARLYLADSGADLLIWGAVVGREERRLKLYLTPAAGVGRPKHSSTGARAYTLDADLSLPPMLLDDIVVVFRWLVSGQEADLLAESGSFLGDDLDRFIQRVEALLNDPAFATGTSAQAIAVIKSSLGIAYNLRGKQRSDLAAFQKSSRLVSQALAPGGLVQGSELWAGAQNNLGNSLTEIGERTNDSQVLQAAIAAYDDAARVFSRECCVKGWGMLQANKCRTYNSLGRLTASVSKLKQSAEYCRDALTAYTYASEPQEWATAENNLCVVLTSVWEKEDSWNLLEDAQRACEAALRVRTQAHAPFDWATTKLNLCTVKVYMGQSRNDESLLQQAISDCDEGLSMYKPSARVDRYAQGQLNRGNALALLGVARQDSRLLCDAFNSHRLAAGAMRSSNSSMAHRASSYAEDDLARLRVLSEGQAAKCVSESPAMKR